MEDCLIEFLVRAKKKTYAGKGPETTPSRPRSHDLEYEEKNLLYIDTYLGGRLFSGEEALWRSGVPLWAMNYSGRVLSDRFNGDFLKKALLLVPKEAPYRGPALFKEGDFIYARKSVGTPEWFQGYESIHCQGELIFECYFHGGSVL